MATAGTGKLLGKEKAAILLVALGTDLSAEVLKHLDEDDVEWLALHVFALSKVSEDVKEQVLTECLQNALAHNFISTGGAQYARDMLHSAFGPRKGDEMISRVVAASKVQPFDFLKDSDPIQLVSFIQSEHPQTIALILSHLKPQQASAILSSLEPDLQADIAARVAIMDRTSPEVVQRIEEVLRKKASPVLMQSYPSVGGVGFLVKILTSVDRGTEKRIIEQLEENNEELATEVKKMMFLFDNIVKLDDRSLQRVLRDVDFRDLALALRGASEELEIRILKNLSSRSAEMLKDEMTMSGPVRVRNVEAAQQKIVSIVRRLDEAEEIFISRGDDDGII